MRDIEQVTGDDLKLHNDLMDEALRAMRRSEDDLLRLEVNLDMAIKGEVKPCKPGARRRIVWLAPKETA
jgi:hypothetical protein